MPTSGAVGTLAQLWLWRLELRVVSTVIAFLALAVIVVVTWAFGVDAGVTTMFAFFGGVIIFVIYSVFQALWLLVSPAARERNLRAAENAYEREMAAIARDSQLR
jgi:uncharacterized membrane protein